jgi:hypothetical protein
MLRFMNAFFILSEFFSPASGQLPFSTIASLGVSLAVIVIALIQSGPSRDDDDQGPGGGGGLMQPVGAGA